MFCKHKWKVLSEHVAESISEQMVRLGCACPIPEDTKAGRLLTKKVRWLTLTCEDCGKLKHFKDEV